MSKILSLFAGEIWAITEDKLRAIETMLSLWNAGQPRNYVAGPPKEKIEPVQGSVAVVNIHGTLLRRISSLEESSGGMSLAHIDANFSYALDNPNFGAIVLSIDSPGGSVAGIQEFATKVYNARKRKPIIAVADTLAASAAYWIGSAAETFVVSPSGAVGSIGVIAMHADESKAIENAGVKFTMITAGKYKGEGSPVEPLGDDARANIQKAVDTYYDYFTSAVAKYRATTQPNVKKTFGEGRVVLAEEALTLGMVDRVDTIDNVLKELTASTKQKRERLAAIDSQRENLKARATTIMGLK